jgi:DNA repair protein NreA
MISPELCIKCKGKLLCGLKQCPILQKSFATNKLKSKIKNNSFSGASPPGFFVSWQNYPKVAVAPLSTLPEDVSPIADKPEEWFGLPQEQIISFRESLLRSYKTMPVSQAADPSYELLDFQEVAMSQNLVDVEVSLKKAPNSESKFDSFSAPMGPSAELDKLSLSDNTKIPGKVDSFFSDTDALSNTALLGLYDAGFSVSYLAKILSSGALGVKKNRKLVPTRWSITAVDSNLSKHFINEELVQNKVIDNFRLFHSNYLDNEFWVLLLPYAWSFEQLEVWLPGGIWTPDAKDYQILADHELNTGLKGYPKETEGAYFASRLAVTEYLVNRKENASAIVFREIGKDYAVPLGVWQIRENVRHALNEKPFEFSTIDLAIEFLSKKLKVPFKQYKEKSTLIKHFKTQTRLSQWF